MDLNEPNRKDNRNAINEDIWSYIKSRSGRYALETVQQDAVSGEKLSFIELSKNVELLASILRNLENLPSGIAICSENNLDYCWILLGVLSAGIRCILLSPKYTARELRHFLHLTLPDVVLCSKSISDKSYENGESFGAICSEYPFVKKIYVWGMTEKNSLHESLSSLLYQGKNLASIQNQQLLEERNLAGTREALILASSGSTGLPKGVILTHRAVVEALKLSSVYARSEESTLGLMPFFHSYGLIVGLMCLCEGSKLIILPELRSPNYLSDVIHEHQINNLYLVPSLLAMIGKFPAFTKEKLSCLRHVWTSASKVSQHIQEKALEIMPQDAVLHHCYGMTETIFVTFTGPYVKPESPGKLVSNIECKIMRGDEVCGTDEVGELCFRGATLMKGYLNNETATMESLQNGWLRSGDLGYRDKDGYFFIVDRIKEMIKYQGNQISPLEIEGIILELPDVLETGVVGLPNEDFGEFPAAGIVLKQSSTLTVEEVKEHVARQVSPHKRLRGGVFFVKELPKTGTGKVQRKELLARIIDMICSSPQER